jgi:hypothetical protein
MAKWSINELRNRSGTSNKRRSVALGATGALVGAIVARLSDSITVMQHHGCSPKILHHLVAGTRLNTRQLSKARTSRLSCTTLI